MTMTIPTDDLEGSEFLQNDVLEAGEEKFFGGNGRGNVFRPADVDSESDGTAKQALAADKGRWFGGNGRGMVFRRAVEDTENAEQVAGATSDHYFGGPRGGGVF